MDKYDQKKRLPLVLGSAAILALIASIITFVLPKGQESSNQAQAPASSVEFSGNSASLPKEKRHHDTYATSGEESSEYVPHDSSPLHYIPHPGEVMDPQNPSDKEYQAALRAYYSDPELSSHSRHRHTHAGTFESTSRADDEEEDAGYTPPRPYSIPKGPR